MRKVIFCALVFALLLVIRVNVFATELKDYDFEDLNEFLENQDSFENIRFEKIVQDILENGIVTLPQNISRLVKNTILSEIRSNRKNIEIIIVITVFSALFVNFSASMENSAVSKSGAFFARFLIGVLLIKNYGIIQGITEKFFVELTDFINCILPVYVFSVSFSTGKVSAIALQQSTMVLLTIFNYGIKLILLPIVKFYVIIGLINMITGDSSIKKMKELTKSFAFWGNNAILTLVTGLNVVKSMVSPYADRTTNLVLQKAVSLIPGVGTNISNAYELVLGTGKYIRNSIGVAGIVVIFILCVVPVLKMIVFVVIYRVCSALLEPIADKAVIEGLSDISDGIMLLLHISFTGAFLFMLTIGIVCT